MMRHKLALAVAVSLSVAAMPAAAFAHGGGGGHGGGGHGGGGYGGGSGRSYSPGTGRSMPGGTQPGRQMPAFVKRGIAGQHAAPLGGRFVTSNGRFAWNDHHRIRGRHVFGLIPGFGYGYYWYYGDCWIWTGYGWIDLCVDGVY
jgi:hypothetical protein